MHRAQKASPWIELRDDCVTGVWSRALQDHVVQLSKSWKQITIFLPFSECHVIRWVHTGEEEVIRDVIVCGTTFPKHLTAGCGLHRERRETRRRHEGEVEAFKEGFAEKEACLKGLLEEQAAQQMQVCACGYISA